MKNFRGRVSSIVNWATGWFPAHPSPRFDPKLLRSIRHFIVGGIVRSGKTTFCKKLVDKFTVCHIPTDILVTSLQNAFPNHNIRHSGLSYEKRCANLAPFLYEFLNQIGSKRDFTYVVDSYHILPSDVAARIDCKDFEVLFFGYPNNTLDEKYNHMTEYAEKHGCWTQRYYPAEDELRKAIKNSISKSKWLQSECKKYNFAFVDTSKDFPGTIARLVESFEKK